MHNRVIRADTIDAVVDAILINLEPDTGSSSSRKNVIYFDGWWDGLGASAVLQAVAERLTTGISNEPATRLAFDKVINIDCSKWESRRALQRKIAEQLKLPNRVMEMLDKQDEEDDFNGFNKGSRYEIAEVVTETYQTINNSRFIVILHNGSDEEIDISNFGLPVHPYITNKMLWTFQGRFRLDPKMTYKVTKSRTTHILLSAACSDEGDIQMIESYLARHEAEQLSCNSKHGDGIIDPAIAAACVLYMLKQRSIGSHIIDYDWDTHTSNYWICDGIIIPAQVGVEIEEIDKAWRYSDALQQEIRINMDEAKESDQTPYWFSTVTSRFEQCPSGVIASNMFQHSDSLGVLKLSRCSFSFSSPPFLCCHSLRFLWLDNCQDLTLTTRSTTYKDSDNHHTDAANNEVEESWECFQSLWVLDLRYTDWVRILSAQVMDLMTQLRELNVMGAKSWDMSHIRGRLCNIRKLRVTKSTCSFDDENLFSEMETMELLEFSGNHITPGGMACLSGPAKGSRLKTVIIDGCDRLKTISLSGCRELKKLLLKGLLGSLEVLDLSGTKVKTLNLGEVDTPVLKRVILLCCEKLRAILWVKEYKRTFTIPDVLLIDTISASSSASSQDAHPIHGDRSLQQQKEEKFNQWQISLADARLLRSLDYTIHWAYQLCIHIDICPGFSYSVNQGTSRDKVAAEQIAASTSTSSSSMVDSKYRDVLKEDGPAYYCSDSSEMMMWEWDCPEIPILRDKKCMCIIKVITQGAATTSSALSLSHATCHEATSMHVYDNSCITSISTPPQALQWPSLRWCRVKRCPKLHTLFAIPRDTNSHVDDFSSLATLWASQLLTARYIWADTLYRTSAVSNTLEFLHLDYCPRLIHVLPFSIPMGESGTIFHYLDTLEIVCCGDLREVFPFVPAGRQEQDNTLVATNNKVDFPRLRRIHLHELPMLHHICSCTMYAPKLETIKIRGCWSLRRLTAIGADTKPPMVDCEKEWWDRLQWDGVEAYHHPSLYRPTHSAYYKDAQLRRGTLLR